MNKKNRYSVFYFFLIVVSYSFTQEALPRKDYEPAGLNPVYALDIGSNFDENGFIPEVYEYYDAYSAFKLSLEPLIFNEEYAFLIGNWKLNYSKEKVFSETERLEMCDQFIIKRKSNTIYFDVGIPIPIYKGQNNDLYIFTYWREILKKIVYDNGNIYIYHLVNDFWVLDAIQEKGKYRYFKVK